MVILASTLLILVEGTAATSDGILLPCMVAVMVLFARGLAQGWRWYHGAALGLALGLGLLAKGPVALLPVVVIVVTLWLIRRSGIRVGPHLGWLGGSTARACCCSSRGPFPPTTPPAGSSCGWGSATTCWRGLPDRWTITAAASCCTCRTMCRSSSPASFPGRCTCREHLAVLHRRVGTGPFPRAVPGVGGVVVVIMTLVATKLPHYILFTWPALALAVGGTLAAAAQGKLAEIDRNWLRGGIYFFGPVAGVAVVGFFVAPLWLHLPGAMVPFWATAALLLAISVLAMRQQLQNRPQASAITLLLGLAVLAFPVLWGVIPPFRERQGLSDPGPSHHADRPLRTSPSQRSTTASPA